MFSRYFGAYRKAGDEVQEVVNAMVDLIEDPETDPDEHHAAVDALFEALFPVRHEDELGIGIQDMREVHDAAESKDACPEIGEEPANFAKRLQALMDARGLNQVALARLTGVQQPAISMMLSRRCHPQRRTVIKIAAALDMPPNELWPGSRADNAAP